MTIFCNSTSCLQSDISTPDISISDSQSCKPCHEKLSVVYAVLPTNELEILGVCESRTDGSLCSREKQRSQTILHSDDMVFHVFLSNHDKYINFISGLLQYSESKREHL